MGISVCDRGIVAVVILIIVIMRGAVSGGEGEGSRSVLFILFFSRQIEVHINTRKSQKTKIIVLQLSKTK